MGREKARVLPAEVAEVRQRIEQWRRTRSKRTAMPQELWSAAVSLAGDYGLYRVARGLGVSYSALKRRVTEAEASKRSTGQADTRAGFVEVDTAPLFSGGEAAGSVVELSDGVGVTMKIRVPASQAVDVVGLVAAFRGGGR